MFTDLTFLGLGVLRVCPALSRRVLQELCKQEPWSGRKEPPAFASSPPRSPPPRLRVPRLPAREGPGPPAQGCRADAGQAKHRAAWGPAPPGLWVWAGGNWQARTAAARMSRARADPLFSDPSVCFFCPNPKVEFLNFQRSLFRLLAHAGSDKHRNGDRSLSGDPEPGDQGHDI